MTHTQCISHTHTQAHAHAHPPHTCKKQFLLVNLQVFAKNKKAFIEQHFDIWAKYVHSYSQIIPHSGIHFCIGRTLWVQLTPGSTAFFIAAKTKTSSTQPSVCCQCNMSKLCMFTGTGDSTKKFPSIF